MPSSACNRLCELSSSPLRTSGRRCDPEYGPRDESAARSWRRLSWTSPFSVATIIEMQIEFDPAKDEGNQAKHGVSLAEASRLDWDEPWCDTMIAGGTARIDSSRPGRWAIGCTS